MATWGDDDGRGMKAVSVVVADILYRYSVLCPGRGGVNGGAGEDSRVFFFFFSPGAGAVAGQRPVRSRCSGLYYLLWKL